MYKEEKGKRNTIMMMMIRDKIVEEESHWNSSLNFQVLLYYSLRTI